RSLDIITLFHKPSSPASVKIATLLKQTSAAASESATEDQASDHSAQATQIPEFELTIVEDPPTPSQLETILDYVPKADIPSIVAGEINKHDALKAFKQNNQKFQVPLVVDWNNGKVVPGANESAILKMLNELPKK
ncbi:thioredoxin-like protein, partial [Lasiosphaeria miniovina]